MASNMQKTKSIVSKPPVHPMNRPSQRQASSSQRSASPPSEIISFGDLVNPDWSKEKRLVYSVQYFGHFYPGEDSDWTQEEVDAEWARQQAISNMDRPAVTERSLAFRTDHPLFKRDIPEWAKPIPEVRWLTSEEVGIQLEKFRANKRKSSDEEWGKVVFYFKFKNP